MRPRVPHQRPAPRARAPRPRSRPVRPARRPRHRRSTRSRPQDPPRKSPRTLRASMPPSSACVVRQSSMTVHGSCVRAHPKQVSTPFIAHASAVLGPIRPIALHVARSTQFWGSSCMTRLAFSSSCGRTMAPKPRRPNPIAVSQLRMRMPGRVQPTPNSPACRSAFQTLQGGIKVLT